MALSATYNSITWDFAADYTVGQFVDGSWWVFDSGEGVTINSVSPAPSAGVNGSMTNPVSGGQHGFDSDADGYNASLSISYPITLNSGDVLLSSVVASSGTQWDGSSITSSHMHLSEVGVLTVLGSIPPSDAFRPGYCDRTQTIYTVSQIVNQNIPNVTPSVAPSAGNFATAAERFARGSERPWMLFAYNFTGRHTHPSLHMFNYHQFVGQFLSELCCYVCTDDVNKTDALHGLIQIGIDMYWCGVTGQADSSFWAAPIIMAGHFLNDSTMKNCFINQTVGFDSETQGIPRDYPDFYFYEDRNDTTTSFIVPAGQNYMNAAVNGQYVFFRNNTAADRGFEHLHPTEWNLTGDAERAATDRGYRIGQDSQQHIGMAVASQICNLWNEWNHPATKAYIERWMSVEDFITEQEIVGSGSTGDNTSGNEFIDSMYTQYWSIESENSSQEASNMAIPVIQTNSKNAVADIAGTSSTISQPSGLVTGNWCFPIVSLEPTGQATSPFDNSTNKPTGFDLVETFGGGTNIDVWGAVYRKQITGDESWPVTVTFADTAQVVDFCSITLRVTGVDNTTPVNVAGSPQSYTSAADKIVPSITTTEASCLGVAVFVFDGADGAPVAVSGTGWTKYDEHIVNTGAVGTTLVIATKEQETAGALGDCTFTPSVSDGAGGFMFAIQGSDGIPTANPDGLSFSKFILSLEGYTGSIADRTMQYLADLGFDTGSLTDRKMAWLGSLGYTGSLNDRLAQWKNA